MKEPLKKLNLINFFLKKRDVDAGGVDTFGGDFSFTFPEIITARIGYLTPTQLKACLNKLKNEEKVNGVPLIIDYIPSGQRYTISGCTTEKLEIQKALLERQLAGQPVDIVKVYVSPTHGVYLDKITKLPSANIGKKGIQLLSLLKNGPKGIVTLREETGGTNQDISRTKNKFVNKIFKNTFNKPHDLIIRLKIGGYKLNNEHYEFKFLE